MNQPNPYLRTKVLTATPQELRLMLYDGAIKFCTQATEALTKKDYEASYNALMRAQKIVLELSTSLKPEMAPELCEKLGALYTYIYRLLVEANMDRDPGGLDEAIKLLQYERETWRLLMEQDADGDPTTGSTSVDSPADVAGAQQTAISSLSISG